MSAGNLAWLDGHSPRRCGRSAAVRHLEVRVHHGRSLGRTLDGTSQWISSPDARADVQELRSTVDAIIVGVGTVLADDPHLDATGPTPEPLANRQPIRVIVDTHDRTPGRRPGPRRRRPHVGGDRAPSWARTATAGSICGQLGQALFERGVPPGTARGWSNAGRRIPARGPGRRGRRLRRAEAARRRQASPGNGRHRDHRRGDRPGADRRPSGRSRPADHARCRRGG